MRESVRKWHNKVLAIHNLLMFESLIYPHNIITESAKQFTFENSEGVEMEPIKGYFAMKDVDNKKIKYFLQEQYYKELPIRVDSCEDLLYKESSRCKSVVLRPLAVTPFRIKPEKVWDDDHQFIDELCPYEHTAPDMYTLMKMIGVATDVGKTCLCICSDSEFGKSSIFISMDSITKRCPVFKPRSVPGVLCQVTGDGNMVFDEVHDIDSQTKRCVEEFSLFCGADDPVYINGAMKAKGLKQRYDISHQSITFLYNIYSYYKNPESEFFDNTFSNNSAIDSRFLKLKMEGVLKEQFDKNFDMISTAKDNRMIYMKIAKHLLYLKQLKLSNGYVRRYPSCSTLNLNGRKKSTYDEISWVIDLYSYDLQEYRKFIGILDKCVHAYQCMIGKREQQLKVTEEPLGTLNFDREHLVWRPCSEPGCYEVECNRCSDGKPYCEKHWKG